jgi:hypothetical protein
LKEPTSRDNDVENTAVFRIQRKIEELPLEAEPGFATSLLAYHLNRKSVLGTDGRGTVIEGLTDYIHTERALRQRVNVPQDHLMVMAGLIREKINKNVDRMRWILQEVKAGRIPLKKKRDLLVELAQLEDDNEQLQTGLQTIVESITHG